MGSERNEGENRVGPRRGGRQAAGAARAKALRQHDLKVTWTEEGESQALKAEGQTSSHRQWGATEGRGECGFLWASPQDTA